MAGRGGVLALVAALIMLISISGGALAKPVMVEEKATFTDVTYTNEHFRMLIDKWGATLFDRQTGNPLARVDWVVVGSDHADGVQALDWITAPTLSVWDQGGSHHVETTGEVGGGLEVKIRFSGTREAPLDSGPKISVELYSLEAYADFHLGWRFSGVSAEVFQLERRVDTLRQALRSWKPGESPSFDTIEEANSLVFLGKQREIRFGANWEDAQPYYSGTQFLNVPFGPAAISWFGPIHLEPGDRTLLDPLLEGGGGGGSCYPGIEGYVTETGTAESLYRVKVRAQKFPTGPTYTVYTDTNGFYSMGTVSGSYNVWVLDAKGVFSTPAQSATTNCSKASLSFQTERKLFWAVNFHDLDAGQNLANLKQAFDYMRDLGVWHVRTDFAWAAVQPNDHISWDQGKLNWLRLYVDTAKERGLDVIGILSNPPGWAMWQYEWANNKEGFFRAWYAYAERIASEFGDDVYYWQMANEENHPVHSFVYEDDEERLFEEAYLGISAGEGVFFSDNFDDGVADGWTLTGGPLGLWRVASDCVTPWRGNYMLSFSRPSPDCDYDIGWAYGNAYSPFIDLSDASEATLTFRHTWETESSTGVYDIMRLFVSSDGVVYNMIKQWDSTDPNPFIYPWDWITEHIDVSDYISSQFRFFFNFDSKDGTFNDFKGWYIDSVQIRSPDHTGDFKTIVNAFADWWDPWGGWHDDLNRWLSESGEFIDVAAVDHYPVSWTCTNADDWAPLDSLTQLLDTYDKDGALMEIGYSTLGETNWYDCNTLTEVGQVQFVNTALPIIKQKVIDYNAAHATRKILLGVWYELYDACTLCFGLKWDKMEWNMGIRRNDWTAKPAFDDLELRMNEFNF